MTDLNPEISYFSAQIRQTYAEDLKKMASLPPEAIDSVLLNSPFNLSTDALETIRRKLEFSFSVRVGAGSVIKSEYTPWLVEEKSNINFIYWMRLREYYLSPDMLPPYVVSGLDSVTDQILDFCGNPKIKTPWARRGMVMGHVQSGKTTNYSSLICKAADAGYKIIILLAGITNSLRQQTQERIDEAFIGKRALFSATIPELMPIMTFCSVGGVHPAYGTSRDQDFSKTVSRYGVTLSNLKDPMIFVVKKNKSILNNLLEWIESQSVGQNIEYPLLLIDDEADNGSINTHKDPSKITAINDVIRRILKKFSRSSYVGYTATPFANIFIDPDTEDQMCGDDLFPRHFIRALEAPDNYVGASRIFDPNGDLYKKMLRPVNDYNNIIPLAHKRDININDLPETLKKAIRAFILVRAIRILRGDGHKHCSMMINVSRYNNIQKQIHGLVYVYQKKLDDAIKVNSGLGEGALLDQNIISLKETFEDEFKNVECTFEDLLIYLIEASDSIVVRTVNMLGGELDYEKNKKNGLHVIAVGGLALSRGLTLEGLAISYILRNAAASDTLMQMARWFGYRSNYEDICRLYICRRSIEHYRYIVEAVEELRGELKRMDLREETPEQFGLKVRRSDTGILITAANKMRSATTLKLAQSFEKKHIEGYALENNKLVNDSNINLVQAFIKQLGPISNALDEDDDLIKYELSKHLAWRNISSVEVIKLIEKFRFHADQPSLGLIDGKTSLFIDYVKDRLTSELNYWDVIIPLNNGRNTSEFTLEPENALPFRARSKGALRKSLNTSAYKPTGDRNRVADPDDKELLLSKSEREQAVNSKIKGESSYCAQRKKPLLIIHVFIAKLEETDAEFQLNGSIVVSLSFCMPKTIKVSEARSYQINPVYKKQLELIYTEEEDDEVMLDD